MGGPPARLHGIDRASAAAGRDRDAVRRHRARRRARLRRRRGGDLLPGERRPWAGRPRRRDVARLPDPVRGRSGGRRRRHAPRAARGRRVGARRRPSGRRPSARRRGSSSSMPRTIRPGCCRPTPSGGARRRVRRARDPPARRRGVPLPRGDEADRLPAGADLCQPGPLDRRHVEVVRDGGAADRLAGVDDRDLLARCAAFKDYTTICASAPSEVLALIALRARDRVLARSRLDRRGQPRASTGSSSGGPARSTGSGRAAARSASRACGRTCRRTGSPPSCVEAEGVLLLPASIFGYPGRSRPDRFRPDGPSRGARRAGAIPGADALLEVAGHDPGGACAGERRMRRSRHTWPTN